MQSALIHTRSTGDTNHFRLNNMKIIAAHARLTDTIHEAPSEINPNAKWSYAIAIRMMIRAVIPFGISWRMFSLE